jgi:hypothetical protein
MSLEAKIKTAIQWSVADDVIVGNGEPEAWETSFAIDGEDQFFNYLTSICTPAEKTELLFDWVLKNGDEQTAGDVIEYMMGKYNPLRSIAKDAAKRIMDHYQSTVDEELSI